MKTIYEETIPDETICTYLDYLIDKVFALLPMYEEAENSDEKRNTFIIYQRNLIQAINGNATLLKYNNCIIVNILSHLQALFNISNHDDYRRHILKICNLLSHLKDEVESNGI